MLQVEVYDAEKKTRTLVESDEMAVPIKE